MVNGAFHLRHEVRIDEMLMSGLYTFTVAVGPKKS